MTVKKALVSPLHKKNSTLDKGYYRPVSILPILSKLYERSMNVQLMDYFKNYFNAYLSAFRPGYGCQSTLLRILEDWKQVLDDKKYVAAILMDLSKAFDCLPHDLLLLKLKYYGLSDSALKLIESYLTNRKQSVKLGTFKSDFQSILKGVPRGSILGPVLFNIFLNDIFHFIEHCILYNYADDNTVSCCDKNLEGLVYKLVKDSMQLIQWFLDNKMKANPEKFQAIAVGQHTRNENITFNLENNVIICEESVKLLGVTIDFQLNFDQHISDICKKASRQLNVLKRIGRHLCKLGKLNVYYSFILSNFNYCPLVWHFCGETNTKKIEKIQERALRFIYSDHSSSYDSLLVKSHLPSLRVRRQRAVALEAFKILNNLSPVYLNDLLTFKHHYYSFRYTKTVEVPHVKTVKYGTRSFRSTAAKIWNSLPQHMRDISDFNAFRNQVNAWSWGTCSCSFCSDG